MNYSRLSLNERINIEVGIQLNKSIRTIAKELNRSPSTISRELKRVEDKDHYAATKAQYAYLQARKRCAPDEKLTPGTVLFGFVEQCLRAKLSPEQISGVLKKMANSSYYVCQETIYNALYALPVGQLKKELLQCLRQGRTTRKPRKGTVDRRGQIPDLVSIHLRPPEVEDRLTPGHWEGDLIKGKGNASAVGTLVERTSGYVMLIKMEDATATSAVIGFSAALNRVPLTFARTMTYDRGKEMAYHAQITQNTGVAIYFCDPHSPWQRGSNENINGLIRQYLPKGTDLSIHSQEELDEIALSLNSRPRKRFNFRSPIEVITELFHKEYEATQMTKH
ncbi:IS30 family transposase [Ignatzschineria larvae DSM 13226]|uniref:IS30 family transposase n=1 Tax=Ignatzschineria larvae DSM 13226 TaxID=1111732 RepID=A0ABZ3BZE7_9GAMM